MSGRDFESAQNWRRDNPDKCVGSCDSFKRSLGDHQRRKIQSQGSIAKKRDQLGWAWRRSWGWTQRRWK